LGLYNDSVLLYILQLCQYCSCFR